MKLDLLTFVMSLVADHRHAMRLVRSAMRAGREPHFPKPLHEFITDGLWDAGYRKVDQ